MKQYWDEYQQNSWVLSVSKLLKAILQKISYSHKSNMEEIRIES